MLFPVWLLTTRLEFTRRKESGFSSWSQENHHVDLPTSWRFWRFGAFGALALSALWHFWRFGAFGGLALLALWRFWRFGAFGGLALLAVWRFWRFGNKMTITSTTVNQKYIHLHEEKLFLTTHLLISQHQVIGLMV